MRTARGQGLGGWRAGPGEQGCEGQEGGVKGVLEGSDEEGSLSPMCDCGRFLCALVSALWRGGHWLWNTFLPVPSKGQQKEACQAGAAEATFLLPPWPPPCAAWAGPQAQALRGCLLPQVEARCWREGGSPHASPALLLPMAQAQAQAQACAGPCGLTQLAGTAVCDAAGDARCHVPCEDGLRGRGRGTANHGERGHFHWVLLVCVLRTRGHCADSCPLSAGDSAGRGVRFRALTWGTGTLSRGMSGRLCASEAFALALRVCSCPKHFRRLQGSIPNIPNKLELFTRDLHFGRFINKRVNNCY